MLGAPVADVTSKLRIKLGLKPLELDSSDSAEKKAEANYAAARDDARRKAEQDELRDKLAKCGCASLSCPRVPPRPGTVH